MSSQKKSERMRTYDHFGTSVIDIGDMEIWDGADLALLRETIARLTQQEGCSALGVDMSSVKYVPSGFFGMLYDLHEKGVKVWVISPLPHVQQMLWFTKFFDDLGEGCFALTPNLSDSDEHLATPNGVALSVNLGT